MTTRARKALTAVEVPTESSSSGHSSLIDLPPVYLTEKSHWQDFKKAINECGLAWSLPDWMTTVRVCVCVLLITNNEELHAVTESETAPWALDESSKIQQTTHSHYATSRNSCPSIRDKIACDTERCRLHETLAQARPQNEVNSRPKRLAANRNSCFRISSPSVLIAPSVSNTIAPKK